MNDAFENFTLILSAELYKKIGCLPVNITIPQDVPPHRLLYGTLDGNISFLETFHKDVGEIGSKRKLGFFIIKGDDLSIEQMQSHMNAFSALLNHAPLKGLVNALFLFYVFENGIPPELKDTQMEERLQTCLFGSVDLKHRKTYYGGYIDLKGISASITPSMSILTGPVKTSLEAWASGADPRTYEEFLEGEINKYRSLISRLTETKPFGTWILMAVCVLMFLWMTFSGGSDAIPVLLRFGANYGPLLRNGEWWRLVGSMFLHIGFIHLLVNMISLLNVGTAMEGYFGNAKYLTLYAISGVSGSLLSGFLRNTFSAGASGAIFGLCGATVYLGYKYKNEIPPDMRKRLGGGMLLCIFYNLFYGFINAGIDNFAHIGGLLAGLAFAMLVKPSAIIKEDKSRSLPYTSLLFIFLALSPFIIESYVIYRAAHNTGVQLYTNIEYRDKGNNISFKYPALMQNFSRKQMASFACPGVIMIYSSFNIEHVPDLKKEENDILETMKISGNCLITRHEYVSVKNRLWFFATGNLIKDFGGIKKDTNTELILTNQGENIYLFQMVLLSNELLDSNDLRKVVMETFQVMNK